MSSSPTRASRWRKSNLSLCLSDWATDTEWEVDRDELELRSREKFLQIFRNPRSRGANMYIITYISE